MMLSYYRSSLIFTALATACGYALGGFSVAWIVLVLGVMETSLSFDNAVVNASVLKNWDQLWRDRFITWGMPVAVFGMRLVFPLLIVGVIAHLNPIAVVTLALEHPAQYAETLASAHHQISAFGGTFLLMVFLKFFVDAEKDTHWLHWFEAPLAKLGRLDTIQVAITGVAIAVVSTFINPIEQVGFLIAAIAGLVTYIVVDAIGGLVGGNEGETSSRIIKQGIGGFLYLEVLDASFSFDGVIGSFALSNNIFIIALGLGVGAMFVRSMTLHLVDKGALNEFKYLEAGAFWAIGALAAIMLASVRVDVPEVITGFIGVGSIIAAFISSVRANKAETAAA